MVKNNKKSSKTALLERQGRMIIGLVIVLYTLVFMVNAYSSNSFYGDYNGFCYQESSNTTNQQGTDGNCLLNYSGNYEYWGDYNYWGLNSVYDGSWITRNTETSGGSYLNITYIKPYNALSSSLWQIGKGVGSATAYNFSIPLDCWNYNNNYLKFYINFSSVGTGTKTLYCYGVGGLNIINTFTNQYFWEDAMVWNISTNLNLVANQNTTRYLQIPSNTILTNGFMNLTFPAYQSVMSTNYFLYYPFDSNSSSWNMSYNLQSFNSPVYVPGHLNNAINFSAPSSQYASNTTANFNLNENYTFSFWYKFGSGNGNILEYKSAGICGIEFDSEGGGTTLTLYQGNCAGGYYPTIQTPMQSGWQMITIMGNSTGTYLYKNTTYIGSTTKSPNMAGITELYLSRDRGGASGYINGAVDELTVWNANLSESKINNIYNNGISTVVSTSNPVALNVANTYINTYSSNSTTINLANLINNYLQTCSYLNGYCNVPFIFNSSVNTNVSYSNLIFNNVGILENNVTYNATSFESSLENFVLNVTYDTDAYSSISVSFNYNNGVYTPTVVDYNTYKLVYDNITLPLITSSVNNTFFWNITLTNSSGSSSYLTTYRNQTLNKVSALSSGLFCPAGYSPSINFTFYYEDNLSLVNITRVDYIINYGLAGNSTSNVINNSLYNINQFTVCINNTQPFFNVGYGEIDYYVTGSEPRKYYIFQNTRITNQSIGIPLYNIENSLATTFSINAQTNSLIPFSNNFIGLLRWYPSLNAYNLVEMGKTDNLGNTILNIKSDSVDYRLALYSIDGTLIKLLTPVRFTCQVQPCLYTITVDTNVLDLTTFTGIQKSLTFNPSNNQFTFVWNDPTQTPQSMNLTVYKVSGTSQDIVCSTSASGYTGLINCDVSLYTGMFNARAVRTASPPMVIAELTQEIRQRLKDVAGGSSIGLLLGAVLLIFFALIGTVSPTLVIILGVISLIPLFILGGITWGVIVTLGVIAGIVLHFLRRIA